MDNIGNTAGLVVTGVHRSHWWWPHSHSAGHSCDCIDIQPGHWPPFALGVPPGAVVITMLCPEAARTAAPIECSRKVALISYLADAYLV